MAGAEPTHHALGAGAFGCVLRVALPCEDGTTHLLDPTAADLSSSTVHKIQRRMDAGTAQNINTILRTVDAGHYLTVPLESLCLVTSAAKAEITEQKCKPVYTALRKNPATPIAQVTMRKGTPLKQHIRESVEAGTLNMHTLYSQLLTLLHGLYSIHQKQIAHGDLKVDNLLMLPDGRIRLIDFDLLFRYDLQFGTPGVPDVPFNQTLEALMPDAIMALFAQAELDQRAAVSTFSAHFPPDNVFLQPSVMENLQGKTAPQKTKVINSAFTVYRKLVSKHSTTTNKYRYDAYFDAARIEENMRILQSYARNEPGKDAEPGSIESMSLADPRRILHNYDPDKFTIYQFGFVLYEVAALVHTLLPIEMFQIKNRLRLLTTDMLMPMSENRIGWEGAMDTLEGIVHDMRRVETGATGEPRLFLYRTNLVAMQESGHLFESLQGNQCTCRDDFKFFSDQLVRNAVINDPTAEFWMVHDDDRQVSHQPSIGRAMSVAVTKPLPDIAGTYIEYLCTTARQHGGASKLLFTLIVAQAVHDKLQLVKLQAASEGLVKDVYQPRYGMQCRDEREAGDPYPYYICYLDISKRAGGLEVPVDSLIEIVRSGSELRLGTPAPMLPPPKPPSPIVKLEYAAAAPRAGRRMRPLGLRSKVPLRVDVDLLSDDEYEGSARLAGAPRGRSAASASTVIPSNLDNSVGARRTSRDLFASAVRASLPAAPSGRSTASKPSNLHNSVGAPRSVPRTSRDPFASSAGRAATPGVPPPPAGYYGPVLDLVSSSSSSRGLRSSPGLHVLMTSSASSGSTAPRSDSRVSTPGVPPPPPPYAAIFESQSPSASSNGSRGSPTVHEILSSSSSSGSRAAKRNRVDVVDLT